MLGKLKIVLPPPQRRLGDIFLFLLCLILSNISGSISAFIIHLIPFIAINLPLLEWNNLLILLKTRYDLSRIR